jgi:protein-L-isoaspartate(D-aspartate) O-methyltransferase
MKHELFELWKNFGIIKNEALLRAFLEIPREEFVLDEYIEHAYDDHPLPTLSGQTISQPSTMMIMIDALDLKKDDVVLEIGAGTGYSAAIMSRLSDRIYTAETITELIEMARKNLEKQEIENVEVMRDDGTLEFYMKFNKIIVTCACPAIPRVLIEQLGNQGILILPIGPKSSQSMLKIKKEDDKLLVEEMGDFIFVPLQGMYGYD